MMHDDPQPQLSSAGAAVARQMAALLAALASLSPAEGYDLAVVLRRRLDRLVLGDVDADPEPRG